MDMQAVMNELRAQRNHALDMVANAQGAIADLTTRLAAAQAQIEELLKKQGVTESV